MSMHRQPALHGRRREKYSGDTFSGTCQRLDTRHLYARAAFLRRQPFCTQKGAAEWQAFSPLARSSAESSQSTVTYRLGRDEKLPFSLRLRYQADAKFWGTLRLSIAVISTGE
jgi:hypothetical protein